MLDESIKPQISIFGGNGPLDRGLVKFRFQIKDLEYIQNLEYTYINIISNFFKFAKSGNPIIERRQSPNCSASTRT